MVKQILTEIKQKLLHFFKGIFRYRLGTIYMLFGYILSFIVLFNGISIYLFRQDALEVAKLQEYSSRTEIQTPQMDPELYIQALQSLPCRVTLKSVLMFSDTAYVVRQVDVVIHDPDAQLQSGCIIGDELEQYVIQKDGKRYYSLDGCLYEVAEIVDGKGGDLSHIISIPYDLLKETSRNILKNRMDLTSAVLESNTLDTQVCKTALEEALGRLAGETVTLITEMSDDNSELKQESKLGIYLCVFAYIFCLINCIIVCEFWIFQRRKEIAVRRAYHFSDDRIKVLLFTDMMRIVAVALMIYLLLQVLIFSWLLEYFSVTMVFDIRSILFMILMVPVSAAVTILPYMRRLQKKSYAAGIREA